MSTYKSVLMTFILFVAFIFPALMNFSFGALHYTAFFKTAFDTVELVRVEGGVSNDVKRYVKNLEDNHNFTITFKNAKTGAVIDTVVPVKTQIAITYDYKYKNVSKEVVLSTSNDVWILRR